MNDDLEEGHFTRHLAQLRGTSQAGMAQLYAALGPTGVRQSCTEPANAQNPRRFPLQAAAGEHQSSGQPTMGPGSTAGFSEKQAAMAAMQDLVDTVQELMRLGGNDSSR